VGAREVIVPLRLGRHVAEQRSRLATLDCRACCTEVDPSQPVGCCPTCGQALLAGYDLTGFDPGRWRRLLHDRAWSLWRYEELLPVQSTSSRVTLGEGCTPILSLGEVPEAVEIGVFLKDDGGLPTGSFKARGMAVAVSRARELGLRELYVPSAGNAASALAAYGARAGIQVRVYLPKATPPALVAASRRYGAESIMVEGTIRDAGEFARRAESGRGSFDMSTLREPYRVEGKKTMALEIWEQCAPEEFPDAIVYPTGGGTGLVGMYKGFTELASLGLLPGMPRLYAVQPEGCAPVARAIREGATRVVPWDAPATVAPGLLVPAPFSSERVLEAIRGSRGGATTVKDGEILEAVEHLARRHGVSASPEGAAAYAALPRLIAEGQLHAGERVLVYNTGSGLPFLA
jgi:threonine synthase